MIIVGRDRLKWNKNDLYYQDKKMISIFHGDVNSDLWWLRWPDGIVSADFYNKTRAKEHAIKIVLQELNNTPEENE